MTNKTSELNDIMIERTHDSFYSEEKNLEVKDLWIEIANLIEKSTPRQGASIADIGCAIGVFPNYLKKRFPQCEVCGFEFLESSLVVGRDTYPNLDLRYGDILNPVDWSEQYDILTCTGVLSIFDDISSPLSNIVKSTKKGGRIYIHSLFNPYPVDVLIKYKLNSKDDHAWEAGWNIFSQDKVKKVMLDLGVKEVKFHEFVISKQINKREDFVRSWTEEVVVDSFGKKKQQIVNGLCLKQPHYIMEALV